MNNNNFYFKVAGRLNDLKIYVGKQNINFNMNSNATTFTRLILHYKPAIQPKAIVALKPYFTDGLSQYILIHKQTTKNPLTDETAVGFLTLKEVLVEGFYNCTRTFFF